MARPPAVAGRGRGGAPARLLWLAVAGVVLLAIVFSYTRATWLALPATGLYYLLLKKGWLRPALLLTGLALATGFVYLSQHNRYLLYAPDYEKTIFNKGDLEKHLEATVKFEDVSGMERLYRWIDGGRQALYRQRPEHFLPGVSEIYGEKLSDLCERQPREVHHP
jgi:O-antigen ligase